MPTGKSLISMFPRRSPRFPGCGPGLMPMPVAGLVTEPVSDDLSLDREPPVILLTPDPLWRNTCLQKVAHIPSGYTYLAQLMGHDMGSSVPLDSVPYVLRGDGPAPAPARRRYNLIENPLTLETVYGPGPTLLSHLYDPDTMLFRLVPGTALTKVHTTDTRVLIRSLYDERNRDTLMLHELTVAVMQYHNRVARLLLDKGQTPARAYARARNHVVRVWHGILDQDLLPRLVHPDIAALDAAALPAVWQLDETTLLIGLFRAFHAMPLGLYTFARPGDPARTGSGPHPIGRLMKKGYGVSDAERFWKVGWEAFLGAGGDGPRTGISLSVDRALKMPAGLLAALDAQSSSAARPLRLTTPDVREMIARLPGGWPARISAEALAQDFVAAHPTAPVLPTADALGRGPLYQVLMAEAQLHGQMGGFGPLGSAVLRASITGSIARVVLTEEDATLAVLDKPRTMLDLITLVRS